MCADVVTGQIVGEGADFWWTLRLERTRSIHPDWPGRAGTGGRVGTGRERASREVADDDHLTDRSAGLDEREGGLRLGEWERPIDDRDDRLGLDERADLRERGAVRLHEQVLEMRALLLC